MVTDAGWLCQALPFNKMVPVIPSSHSRTVMRGLDPRICRVKEDGRIKSGHDVTGNSFRRLNASG
jgi:hypothetical protein